VFTAVEEGAGAFGEGIVTGVDKLTGLVLNGLTLNVVEDVDKFRYNVRDNRRIGQVAVHRVFRKSGKYIFQLGIVNFMEQLIVNLFLVIHCFQREKSIYEEAAHDAVLEHKVTLPYLRTHVSQFSSFCKLFFIYFLRMLTDLFVGFFRFALFRSMLC